MRGKVSRRQPLAYTPRGAAVFEFDLAVPQRFMDRGSRGCFTVVVTGESAVELAPKVRVGTELALSGTLWERNYRDTKGRRIRETKIVFSSLL